MISRDDQKAIKGGILSTTAITCVVSILNDSSYIWTSYQDGSSPPAGFVIFGMAASTCFIIATCGLLRDIRHLRRGDVKLLLGISLLSIANFIFGFAAMYRHYGLQSDGHEVRDPFLFVYFSVMTWTTVGYGDVSPIGYSRQIASIEALFGQFVFALSIGIISQLLRVLFIEPLSRSDDDVIT